MLIQDEPPINAVNVLYENASNITTDIVNNVTIINIYMNDIDKSIVEDIFEKLRPDKINCNLKRKT